MAGPCLIRPTIGLELFIEPPGMKLGIRGALTEPVTDRKGGLTICAYVRNNTLYLQREIVYRKKRNFRPGRMGVFNDATKKPRIKAGYGTKKKARDTIRRLRSVSRKKAQAIARTMYYRAKFNKNQTPGMRNAMKVYKEYLDANLTS
jgi:hypothetical protein